ncbi:hypothetical protein [Metabacillus fastidiosus]|uniref:hypothetical protein n=1 Tax=Metabacillus fastidiosus TaxID=1458 RepID=UPI003D29406A
MSEKEDKKAEVVPLHIKYPETLIKKIDAYKLENHHVSRTSAIFELIRIGLGELEKKK